MNSQTGLTVGDKIKLSGAITQRSLASLADASGCSATFSLIDTDDDSFIVSEAPATITGFTKTRMPDASFVGAIAVAYAFTADAAVDQARIRWTLTLGDGSVMHAPGPLEDQAFIVIKAN